jgi:hypothetical protein
MMLDRSLLAGRFSSLPFSAQRGIAERLGLTELIDDCFLSVSQSAAWLRRAAERGLNNALHVAVEAFAA